MKKLLFLIILIIALASCGFENWSRENNLGGEQKIAMSEKKYGEFVVQKLFTTDEGVSVYRFIDAAHTRYFAINEKTKDMVSVISSTSEKSGKTTIEEDDSIIIMK